MKIAGTYGPNILEPNKTGKKSVTAKHDFKTVMDEVLGGKEPGISTSTAPAKPNMINGVNGLDLKHGVLNPSSVVSGHVEELLNQLDFYAGKLGDASIRAEDLGPLVENMVLGISALDKFRSENEIPAKLDNIISDLVATISSEVEKFRRGDYS